MFFFSATCKICDIHIDVKPQTIIHLQWLGCGIIECWKRWTDSDVKKYEHFPPGARHCVAVRENMSSRVVRTIKSNLWHVVDRDFVAFHLILLPSLTFSSIVPTFLISFLLISFSLRPSLWPLTESRRLLLLLLLLIISDRNHSAHNIIANTWRRLMLTHWHWLLLNGRRCCCRCHRHLVWFAGEIPMWWTRDEIAALLINIAHVWLSTSRRDKVLCRHYWSSWKWWLHHVNRCLAGCWCWLVHGDVVPDSNARISHYLTTLASTAKGRVMRDGRRRLLVNEILRVLLKSDVRVGRRSSHNEAHLILILLRVELDWWVQGLGCAVARCLYFS